MRTAFLSVLLAACTVLAPAIASPPTVTRVEAVSSHAIAAPIAIGGRVVAEGNGMLAWQWPGVYFETAFRGDSIAFKIGAGEAILHVLADGRRIATLEKPAIGTYRIDGLAEGVHVVRIEAATESQAGPNYFGGFSIAADANALTLPARARRIEFIGDSHTVGYGNRSAQRECSEAQVWATTDTSRAFGPRVARHYAADYRINAISGRGVVRNYGGMAADTLPQAWPYRLLDRSARDDDPAWQPQVVVIALGTNDFSTPLGASERWPDRQALREDYMRIYAGFVQSLRARYPQARFVLWSTDLHDGEILAQAERVVAQLRAGGETRVSFLPIDGLEMGGCHGHPSLADHARIADLLVGHLDAQAETWGETTTGTTPRSAR
jgi:lysophospholipase L1-like esterase